MLIHMDTPHAQAHRLIAVLRDAALEANASSQTLGETAGIPSATFHRLVDGDDHGFDVVEIIALCEILGLSLADVARRAEENPLTSSVITTVRTRRNKDLRNATTGSPNRHISGSAPR